MKVLRRVLLLLFIFFSFVPSLSPIFFKQNLKQLFAREEQAIAGYEEWAEDKEISSDITIEAGGMLVIKRGVKIVFNGGRLNVEGNLFVKGTNKENVLFQGKNNSSSLVNIWNGGEVFMTGVDISGSGGGAFPVMKDDLFANALAWSSGAINVNGGKLTIENSSIHDNFIGIYISNSVSSQNIKVNRSKFFNNSSYDAIYGGYQPNPPLDFRYNWWGDSDGPQKEELDYDYGRIMYRYLSDGIDFSSWLTEADFLDPVIIIPGILGSQKKDDKWQIDPVFHIYDNLYQELADNGYAPEKDLFAFPYEWRDSNVDNAKLLRDKINQIKKDRNWPKVDIVAHSMGGLLAREYIESNYYQDDVDQLITLGTPHNGAPEAYLKWDGNAWLLNAGDLYVKHMVEQEAKENEFSDVFDYLHQRPVSSLKELLPVYDYLQNVKMGTYKNYPTGYPRNEFLENLNSEIKKEKLRYIEFDKIIGNLNNVESTISGMKIIETDMGKLWQHGYPHGFEVIIGDRGLIKNEGDQTVPIESARSNNVPEDLLLEINSDHRGLPTEAQKDVLELLTDKRPKNENRDSLIKDMLLVHVFSPIDIQIVAPDGKRMGKNFSTGGTFNEIDGAYYTGSDVDSEFVSIPNPQEGDYQILTQGTGSGEYKIEATRIVENKNSSQDDSESTAVFQGTATLGDKNNFVATISKNEIKNENTETISSGKGKNGASKNNSHSRKKYSSHKESSGRNDLKEKQKRTIPEKIPKILAAVGTKSESRPESNLSQTKNQKQEIFGLPLRQYDIQSLENSVYANSKGERSFIWSGFAYIFQRILNFFSWRFSFF